MSVQSVCEEHITHFFIGISDESGGWVRYPNQKQWMFSPQMDWPWVFCCFIIYYTFNVDLIGFYRFTLGTILYKKLVPAMRYPCRDHLAGDHKKQTIVLYVIMCKGM